jgi:TPR repeat protein
MSDEQSVVYRTQNVMEAQSVKDILGAEGIKAFVFDDHLLSLNPLIGHALGGIKVAVDTKDYSRAERVLRKALKTGKTGRLSGSISPIGDTTTGSVPTESTDIRALLVILAFVLFIGALFFFSPGRLAVFFHRTVPMLFARRPYTVRLRQVSPETRAGMSQPLDALLTKAQAGDKESQYYVGWKYYFGDGVQKSDSLAVQWIQRRLKTDL